MDPAPTIYNRWNRWSRQGVRERIFYALTGSSGVFTGSVNSTHIKAHRSAAGAKGGLVITPLAPCAVGARPKSTRWAMIAARPVAFALTPGNAHDLAGAKALLAIRCPSHKLLADRAYDAASLRDWLAERGTEPVIPPNPTRKNPHAYDRDAYRGRNRIERMFCKSEGLPPHRHTLRQTRRQSSCQPSVSRPLSLG